MFLVSGLPASGKSTVARRFGRVLEYDAFAESLGSYADLEEERDAVSRQFALLAASGLYDATVDVFPSRKSRARILKACPGARLVLVQAPLETCLQRNARRRGSWLGNDELVSIAMQFEPASPDEGFGSIEIFDNSKELSMADEKIWLKAIRGQVLAFGDKESLRAATEGRYDMEISVEEWERHGCAARLEEGRIVLGDPAEVVYARNAEIIRNERYLRLRACDKISPMRWNAMTEAQRADWTAYRQALLDIPQQPGFPWGGDPDKAPWPVKPE